MRITQGIHYLVWWLNLYSIHFSIIQAQCTGNGLFKECACNFINACKYDESAKKFNAFPGSARDLEKFIPNVKFFSTSTVTSQVAEICEPGNIGIIYDCLKRIPLAATTVLTADQYGGEYTRPSMSFKTSSQIGRDLQQNDVDYTDALNRIACYETTKTTKPQNFTEQKWYEALTNGIVVSDTNPCGHNMKESATPVHRGHLIAASYGRGTPGNMRIKETFVYTNAVPQFGRLNSGHWRVFEENLLTWAEKNCKGAPLHIIVGTIPSTYWPNDWRFFGEAGFSDFVGSSKILTGKSPYRVNVPAYMWTAACCHSDSRKLTKSTAFFAPNSPGFGLVRGVGVSDLFLAIRVAPADISAVDLFPQLDDCNKAENYIKI